MATPMTPLHEPTPVLPLLVVMCMLASLARDRSRPQHQEPELNEEASV
jgi:hypothetical protein